MGPAAFKGAAGPRRAEWRDALRPLRRPPPHPADRPRLRRAARSRRWPRSSTATKRFPYEIVAQARRARADGHPVPRGVRRRGRRHAAPTRWPSRSSRAWTRRVAITLCAHTSLGTQPIYLFGSEEQKAALLPDLCAGAQARRLRPDRARGRHRRRQRAHARARLEDGEWVDQRRQAVHHQRRHRHLRPRRDHRARPATDEISNLIVENGTPGYEQGEPYRKMGWNASDTRPLTFTDCRVPEENLLGPRGAGLQAVPAHPRHRAHRRRGDGRRPRAGRARRGAGLRQGAPRVRPADLEVPGHPGQARRHGHRDRGRAPARPTRPPS